MIDYWEYRFRFAAWAAARATAMGAGISLTTRESCEVLKATGFYEMAQKGVEGLPCTQDDATAYDANHCAWCEKVLEEVSKVAQRRGKENWKHGRAAKLINVFLKALMPANLEGLSDEKKKKWDAVHPPIDSMVLEGMEKHGIGDSAFWNSLPYRWEYNGGDREKKYEWTNFGYEQYQSVIDLIRDNLKNCGETDPLPLWKNERFFNPC